MSLFKMIRFFLAIILCIFSYAASAEVYRCVSISGEVAYRDSPCNIRNEQQEIVSIPSHPPKASSIREDKRNFRNIQHYLERETKQRAREAARLEKQREKEFKKEERLAEKCHKAGEKLSDIEFELRLGCKAQRCQRLKRELTKQISKQRQYCQAR